MLVSFDLTKAKGHFCGDTAVFASLQSSAVVEVTPLSVFCTDDYRALACWSTVACGGDSDHINIPKWYLGSL
jgi:hypothetical protein